MFSRLDGFPVWGRGENFLGGEGGVIFERGVGEGPAKGRTQILKIDLCRG